MSADFVTTLITGGNNQTREQWTWNKVFQLLGDAKPKTDLVVINSKEIMAQEEKKSVGIEHSRKLTKFLKEKPFNHKVKVGLILEAQYLTIEAQNALLKTLEEPPANSYLILTAPKKSSLIPTVISRCFVTKLQNLPIDSYLYISEELLRLLFDRAYALDWVNGHKDQIETREEALVLLEKWEGELRQQLVKNHQKWAVNAVVRLWETRSVVENTNVNIRLAIEEWLLKG